MAKIMNDNFQINVGNPIDSKYLNTENAPYALPSDVLTAIPQSQRYIGLTVNVNNVEYWFYNGVADGNFMIKDSGIASTGITTAINGLTKVGTAVRLGGTLTGTTTITKGGSNTAGIEYAADYSSTFSLRSLTDWSTVVTMKSTGKTGNFTLSLPMLGEAVVVTSATPVIATIPLDSSVNFPIGAMITIQQGGAGVVTASGQTGGVTINGVVLSTTKQYSFVQYWKTAANTWSVIGGAIEIWQTSGSSLIVPVDPLKRVPIQFISGLTTALNGYVCTAGNGLTKSGQRVILGGSLTGATTIAAGANDFNVTSTSGNVSLGNTSDSYVVINQNSDYVCLGNSVGGKILANTSGVDITGCAKLQTTPSTGVSTDGFLVWNSGDKCIKQVNVGSIIAGSITGATNGLTKVGQKVILGGTLTGDTCVCSPLYNLAFGDATKSGIIINATNNPATCTNVISGSCVTQLNIYPKTAILTSSNSTNQAFVRVNSTNPSPEVCTVADNGTNCSILDVTDSIICIKSNAMCVCSASGSFAGMKYASDNSPYFVARSIPDVAYVTGSTTANNGLTKSGKIVSLGGILTGNTAIEGAYKFGLNVNKVNITGATSGVSLGGNVYLKTVPTTAIGDVLTYNASTGAIQKTTLSSLGGLTGATNGLHVSGQNAHLGGTLIENTHLEGAYCWDIDAVRGFNVRTSGNTDMNIDAQQCGGFLIKSQCGSIDTFPDFTAAVGFLGHVTEPNGFAVYDNRTGTGQTGIVYAADYSINYIPRSLVDKQYVDSVATGLNVHTAVVVATTGPITLSGNPTVDGIVTQNGWRVLVKNQASGATNGIYVVSAGVWSRSSDYDGTPSGEVSNGDLIPVTSGNTQNNELWALTTLNPITVGVTPLTFSLFSTMIDVQAGQGIAISTIGGVHTVCTNLATLCGLTYCGNGLAVNPTIAGIALTYTNGIIDVCAANCGSVGAIPVGYNSAECLVVACSDIISAMGTPINTAVNGLTKLGSTVVLGGNLTGNTTITMPAVGSTSLTFTDSRVSPSGVQYGANYGATFVDRSLVDKYFVNNRITGGTTILTASNGLTKTSTNVALGGTVTGATNIYVSAQLTIGSGNNISISGNCTHIGSSSVGGYTDFRGSNQLITFGNGISVFCSFASANGITYAQDYSANYTPRTLVDKGYVTGLTTQGIKTANNGLTKVGQNVALGGILTGNTCVDTLGTYTFKVGDFSTNKAKIEIDSNKNVVLLSCCGLNCAQLTIDGPTCQKAQMYAADATQSGMIQALSYCNTISTNCGGNNTLIETSAMAIGLGVLGAGASTFQGAKYCANYGANFTARSLVDAEYVTGKTSQAIQTASNGLTKQANNNVVLGGNLTGNTAIGVINGLNFTIGAGNPANFFGGRVDLGRCDTISCQNYLSLGARIGAGSRSCITIIPTGITIVGNDAGFKGAVYGADYSANFIARSLVDAAYVTGKTSTSGVQTVNNGLTKYGTNAVLGGSLTGNTYILPSSSCFWIGGNGTMITALMATCGNYINIGSQGGGSCTVLKSSQNLLTFSAGTALFCGYGNHGIKYAEDYSSTFTARSIPDAQWVTGQTSAIGANNGLTRAGNYISLGGALTGNTNIGGAYTLALTCATNLSTQTGYQISGVTILKTSTATSSSIFVGANGGNGTGEYNLGFGNQVLVGITTGSNNIGIGQQALNATCSGSWNIGIGGEPLYSNTTGSDNIALGCRVMYGNTTGRCNIALGKQALYQNDTGCNNVAIGCGAGCNNNGCSNIFIGTCAGASATSSNKLYIANGEVNPLIYGDFALSAVTLNAKLTLGVVPTAGSISDSVLVRNSGGEVRTVVGSSLGDKNNIYARTVITTGVTLTTGSTYVILANHSGPITITLPATPLAGQAFKIKDTSGNAVTNNITVAGNTRLIDGSSSGTINTDFGALELVYDNTLNAWFSLAFIN